MIHKIDLTHDYDTTIYDAARRCLTAGADPGDTVETWREGKLSMTGRIGELAKWQVEFRAHGPRLARCKGRGIGPLTAGIASGWAEVASAVEAPVAT
jgi:hypothetical protein